MPIKTAANLITKYRQSGKIAPLPTGGRRAIYNKELISGFIVELLGGNSTMTLQELAEEIWKNKKFLLGKHISHAPSLSWLYNVLKEPVYHYKPITLKVASYDPTRRNSIEVLQQHYDFVQWFHHLSLDDKLRIVWVDEHPLNFFTLKKCGRSFQGQPATIPSASARCINVSVILGVSASFGKIYMMPLDKPTNHFNFSAFLVTLQTKWLTNPLVPEHIQKLGPIIVLDNLKAHNCKQLLEMEHKFLPAYSPFLNLAEFSNHDHKLAIRKLF